MDLNFTVSDWLTLIFGLAGVLGATYTIWSKWDSKREKLEVKNNSGFLTYETRISEEYYLFLECINHSERMVTLASCYLELPDKKNIPGYHQNVFGLHFPFELNPGKSFRYAFDAASLTNTLLKQGFKSHVKIKPVFTTEKGNRFEGKPFLYPLEC